MQFNPQFLTMNRHTLNIIKRSAWHNENAIMANEWHKINIDYELNLGH